MWMQLTVISVQGTAEGNEHKPPVLVRVRVRAQTTNLHATTIPLNDSIIVTKHKNQYAKEKMRTKAGSGSPLWRTKL